MTQDGPIYRPHIIHDLVGRAITGEQRKEVEECLTKRMTFKAIGRFLEKDPTTISYEVMHHRTEH
ncbi:MAG: helix-turn-helix domain-containing protein [Clostridia bacterium]|nr:helix-turn-helix domain-containing protein [Clostridia bacterium]